MTNFMQELRSWHMEQLADFHVIDEPSMVPPSEHEVVEEDNMSEGSSYGDVMPEVEPEFEPERAKKSHPPQTVHKSPWRWMNERVPLNLLR